MGIRWRSVFLVLVIFSLAGCGGAEEVNNSSNDGDDADAGYSEDVEDDVNAEDAQDVNADDVEDDEDVEEEWDPPTAEDIEVSTAEDQSVTITIRGEDPNESGLDFLLVSGPENGSISGMTPGENPDLESSLTYLPAPDFNGEDSFVYRVENERGLSATGEVTIEVTPVNDAPSFVVGADQSVDEDADEQVVDDWATQISQGPADEEDQELMFNVDVLAGDELLVAPPSIADDGMLTYEPALDAVGTAVFSVTLADDGGTEDGGVDTSEAAIVAIHIGPVNDAPQALAGSDQTDMNHAVTVVLQGYDVDEEKLSFEITGEPAQGFVSQLTSTGPDTAQVLYVPEADEAYTTSFEFTVDDGTTVSEPAEVEIEVLDYNHAPTINLDMWAGSTPLIEVPSSFGWDGVRDMPISIYDREYLDDEGDQNAPYYFRFEVVEWPDSDLETIFEWVNYDPLRLSFDRLEYPPQFENDIAGYLQFSALLTRANLLLDGLEWRLNAVGEYTLEITVIDNGFSGRCPDSLIPPDPAELDDFGPSDYRVTKGREGDLKNGNPERCIRETTVQLRINQTDPDGAIIEFVAGGSL